MNRFEQWMLKRIIRKQVTQGYTHHAQVANLYQLIRSAWEQEFHEDNQATHDEMLLEAFRAKPAQKAILAIGELQPC